MILFCLPYAGGSKSIYRNWKKHLKDSITLFPIELKGHGTRYAESFYENIEEAIEDVYTLIKDKIDMENYAILGHSMGSLLAYELYYKIDQMNKKKPKHIFFLGHGAPNIKKQYEISHLLPDDKFIEKIMALGGTPEEVINNQELLSIFVPILKNDFKLLDSYKYIDKKQKINCDISIMYGDNDTIALPEIHEWSRHTNKEFNIYKFHGTHFFINEHVESITNIINTKLLSTKG
ncbi:thioesterase II family protein [Bacillus cereus]|uniref:Thioesterase domain-containing protein n=1 Tax=Bacillus cereus HuA2-1 TaxID=1053201 RepID=J8YXL4_BACCE|nr:thioesterase domain-containing protein [Bacillus cereus]EJV87808.1 hypothetical protein IG3_01295 [Bacillus cereus HuA2-1]